MKILLTLVAALFFVTVAAHAQIGLIGDPGATLLGQSTVTTHVEIDIAGTKRGHDIANEVFILRTSQGQIVVSLDANTILPVGQGDINYIPTLDVFQQVSKSAVAEAIRLQHITQNGPTKVYYASQVDRIGQGTSTRFPACSTNGVARNYEVIFNGGVATVLEMATPPSPTACGAGGAIE